MAHKYQIAPSKGQNRPFPKNRIKLPLLQIIGNPPKEVYWIRHYLRWPYLYVKSPQLIKVSINFPHQRLIHYGKWVKQSRILQSNAMIASSFHLLEMWNCKKIIHLRMIHSRLGPVIFDGKNRKTVIQETPNILRMHKY